MNRKLCYVSLFSGGMGLDLGLEAVGLEPLLLADNDEAAIATIKANRPNVPLFCEDVSSLTGAEVRRVSRVGSGEIDLLAGGPPCQSFSTAGKRLSLADSTRGPLVFEFVRLLAELKPRAFLMENVKGLLSASTVWRQLPYNNNGKVIDDHHGSLMRELLNRIRSLGYSVAYRELNAAD